jgi:hypothetical protein
LVVLQEWKTEQVFRRSGGEGLVLFNRERRKTMSGL